jgi:hypothetical protein
VHRAPCSALRRPAPPRSVARAPFCPAAAAEATPHRASVPRPARSALWRGGVPAPQVRLQHPFLQHRCCHDTRCTIMRGGAS